MPEVILPGLAELIELEIFTHDRSKYSEEEFAPYAEYFYGEQTSEISANFDYAWLHHIHHNPHHWQHWVLVNDDDGTKALDMPYEHIIAMFCDHWAFSWKSNNLTEIFTWYEAHKETIIFSEKTKQIYEDLLSKLRAILEQQK